MATHFHLRMLDECTDPRCGGYPCPQPLKDRHLEIVEKVSGEEPCPACPDWQVEEARLQQFHDEVRDVMIRYKVPHVDLELVGFF